MRCGLFFFSWGYRLRLLQVGGLERLDWPGELRQETRGPRGTEMLRGFLSEDLTGRRGFAALAVRNAPIMTGVWFIDEKCDCVSGFVSLPIDQCCCCKTYRNPTGRWSASLCGGGCCCLGAYVRWREFQRGIMRTGKRRGATQGVCMCRAEGEANYVHEEIIEIFRPLRVAVAVGVDIWLRSDTDAGTRGEEPRACQSYRCHVAGRRRGREGLRASFRERTLHLWQSLLILTPGRRWMDG